MRTTTALALASLTVLAMGCGRNSKPSQAGAVLAPLAAVGPTEALVVPGFGDAVVAAPIGATRAMPVVVAVLGIGDTPELQCQNWRDLVQSRAFVLCPRGLPHMVQVEGANDAGDVAALEESEGEPSDAAPIALSPPHQEGFYPSDVATLDREVTAGLDALSKKYGAYVAPKGRLYAGFSRGAYLGASFVAKHPEHYARAVLIEGGHTPWTDETAKQFANAGGKRLLFACGRQSCVDDANAASGILTKNGIETRVVYGAGEGHGYKRQVKDELRRSFDWIVEGDPAWPSTMATL